MIINQNNLEELKKKLLEKCTDNNIYIYGAGIHGDVLGRFFNYNKIRWVSYIDQDGKKQNTILNNKPILKVENIHWSEKDILIVSLSKFQHIVNYNDIIEKLTQYVYSAKNILYFDNNYMLQDSILKQILYSDEMKNKLKKLKDIYRGKACYIIGNGPSLRLDDLERLKGKITFGCNGLLDIYSKTNWRATNFFGSDSSFVKKYIQNEKQMKKICEEHENFFSSIVNIPIFEQTGIESNDAILFFVCKDSKIKFSEDLSERVYEAGTSIYAMLQAAVYMGVKEIYLLGMDFDFRKTINENGKLVIDNTVQDHMNLIDQTTAGIYKKDLIEQGYICAKKYCESIGVKIYNATRGGKLEIFERVDFDSLFEKE